MQPFLSKLLVLPSKLKMDTDKVGQSHAQLCCLLVHPNTTNTGNQSPTPCTPNPLTYPAHDVTAAGVPGRLHQGDHEALPCCAQPVAQERAAGWRADPAGDPHPLGSRHDAVLLRGAPGPRPLEVRGGVPAGEVPAGESAGRFKMAVCLTRAHKAHFHSWGHGLALSLAKARLIRICVYWVCTGMLSWRIFCNLLPDLAAEKRTCAQCACIQ
jgi:hypothetical protein